MSNVSVTRVPPSAGVSSQRQRCPAKWDQARTRSGSNSTTRDVTRYGTPTFIFMPTNPSAEKVAASDFVRACHTRAEESCLKLRRRLAYAEELTEVLAKASFQSTLDAETQQ